MNLRNACQIIETGASGSKQVSDITTTKSETEEKAKQQKKNRKTETNKREVKLDKKLEGMKLDEEKFMANFDPVHSARETRKMQKKLHNQKSKNGAIYDEKGVHVETGLDMCDCLNLKCPGCFFPCPKCAGSKCGEECRVNRKSVVMDISIEGTDITVRNPLMKFRR